MCYISAVNSRCRYIFKGSTYNFFGCLFKIYFKNINFDRIGFTNLTLATSYFKGLSEKWLVASFLRFDNQTFKVWKTAWIQNYCLCILTLYPNTGPLKFWHVCCCHVFFFAIPKYMKAQNNILSCFMGWPFTSLAENGENHCVKSVQIRSFFWSVFSCTRTKHGDQSEYRKIRTRKNSKFGHFSRIESAICLAYQANLLCKINFLFSLVRLFHNAILHKILQLEFLNFKFIFLKM